MFYPKELLDEIERVGIVPKLYELERLAATEACAQFVASIARSLGQAAIESGAGLGEAVALGKTAAEFYFGEYLAMMGNPTFADRWQLKVGDGPTEGSLDIRIVEVGGKL